ncbi:hypothetical protein OEZ86_010663 [Tetradesmus obliquus]|nr:hypothetical protein OEZ86_010663 [Tetradesmus obliquus]
MGDWAGEERSGCLVLRELPPRPTQRTCKVSADLEQKTQALDLDCFPGEHGEQQLQLQAFQEAWGAINSTIKDLREQHLKPGGGCSSSLGVPVLVLQEADGGDLEALEELVVALSEARTAGLPIVLVLGVSCSPACLLQLLPNALLRRASLLSLALPPARQQLVQVYRQLLLCEPALLLGPQLSAWLLQHFRDADCSASMAERVMQLSCLASRDASLQLPSLFSAASQQHFLQSSKRGSLSPCGHVLLKLLGNSSSSSSSGRSGVVACAAQAVHAALTEPSARMPGHPQLMEPGWEDTCLAYMLLQQQREDGMPVADWFGLFCQAQGVQGFSSAADAAAMEADEEGAAAPGTGRAARARARQGRKARGYAEARDSAAAAAAAAAQAPGSSKKKAGSSSRDQATPKKRGAAAAAAVADADSAGVDQQQQVDAQELMVAAARFCQAAAELQLLGVWKASKRRRLAAVTRMFAPEGPGMVLRGAAADGAAAAAAALESLPDHDYDY